MNELEKNEKLGNLYAYYGSLLTQGQQEYFEDYYYNDLSLGEIADNHQVSRQAVYDNLRRSSKALENYESKLHMAQDYQKFGKLTQEISHALSDGNKQLAQEKTDYLLNELGEV
ncbi:YlxM family DNA-binding protein [Lactobacillus sp. PV034]|uniref:YlxM family DNA-binding protein n=1 Tax=Lactobacillus sp. PV034 TaxID=2594495 RepID=UPI00223EFD67|nr:transcriptional regulator [Lactobacillus sp. PV034]QNQ80305.1 transcriptional regulator [Lactobacillus sp. PV034]